MTTAPAGLQELYDDETRKIVDILQRAAPVRIIRYGSAARHNLRWKSDLDLCVIIERSEELPWFRMNQQLRFLLRDHRYAYRIPLDLKTYTPEEFDALVQGGDPLAREIAQGEVVYERA